MKIEIPAGVKYIVGIDEVGRGPLAGPIAFCAFKVPAGFAATGFGIRIRDSKLLSPEKRAAVFRKLAGLKKEKKADFAVCFESAKKIDRMNIAEAGKRCIARTLRQIKARPAECLVLLDGGIRAPKKFIHQKTIVGGDRKVRAIAFASVAAKVSRDAYMCRLAEKFPAYGFEIHKGYGTALHRRNILEHGLSPEHRASFCRKLLGAA